MINFLNDNLLIISLILILIILFTLLFRRIRKYVYSTCLTSFIPVVVALLHEMGFGFNFSYIIFEKVAFISFGFLEKLQNLFLDQKDSLFFLVNAENEILVLSLDFINSLYSKIKMVVIKIRTKAKATKNQISNNYAVFKQKIIKRINLSRLTLVYRL